MDNTQKTMSPRTIIQVLFFVLVIPFLPLLISWQWGWWEAWVYAFVAIGGFVVSRMVAGRRQSGLLAERSHLLQHEDIKSWDKLLAPLVSLGGGLVPLAAGLEALLGRTLTFGWAIRVVALVLILAGYVLGSYALAENRFFSGVVRIQSERGHQVVSSGPYRWMRHPGYAGALLTYLATPFFLDSLWAFLPAVLIVAALVVRTALEDQTLQKELAGYREYAGRVRYRLLPGVW